MKPGTRAFIRRKRIGLNLYRLFFSSEMHGWFECFPSTTFRKKYQCHLLYLVSDYSNSFQSQIKYLQNIFWQTAIEMGSLFLPWRLPSSAVFTGTSFIKLCCLSSVILIWPTCTHTHTQTHTISNHIVVKASMSTLIFLEIVHLSFLRANVKTCLS
jgi:hypothetical protein